jgi:Large-conductance mechanosensitive channel, MscL
VSIRGVWVRPIVRALKGGAVLREFRDFVTRGNLIELAVAFILGIAFAAVVGAFSNVILSLIGATFGADLTYPSTRACPECTIQIPNAAKRCPNCTSLVTPVA